MEENNIQNQTNNVQNENEQNSNNNGGKKISIGLVTIVLVLVLGIGIGGGFLITKNEVFNKKNTQNATSSNTNKTENAIQNGGNETESKNYFEANKDLTYTSNPKDSINGKVAIIKRGENIFQTEKHDGYYTYKDMFSNSYDIKEITNITSEYKMTSNNGEVNLFKATIEYIDNNNNKKSFDVAVIVPKDQNQAGIAGTYDNYTGTTSFVKEFTNLYEGPSEAENIIENGTYKRTSDGNASGSSLVITNTTSNSFKFEIDAYRYTRPEDIQWCIDNGAVNIGGLKGVANKVTSNKYEYIETDKGILDLCGGSYKVQFVIDSNKNIAISVIMADSSHGDPYCGARVTLDGTYAKNNSNLGNTPSVNSDYSVFSSYKGQAFKNEDYNTTSEGAKEYCELKFDDNCKPLIKMGYKSDNNTECYFQTKDISNLKSDGAAGTTYVTFDFTAWTAGGDTTGNATISFSNVSNDYTMTINAKVNYNIGAKEYTNIKVKQVGQTSVENFTLPEFKNRVYESEKKENSFWYKLEFDENGKPMITEGYLAGGVSQIVDTYRRFTDVYSEGAAGSVYVTFSYRLLNETGDKVEGRLHYSNNTDNKEIYLKMYNKENNDSEINLKQVK